ncbi:MAG TPA: ThiF family adenylyltransferase [Candidatus Acidoferrales bacterium]|jgi:adenylyltransferase/sulfurtransferase|nr:ThiF family adenylyltransferase [Candidatus Acidoferrales bacterium]
MSEERHMQPDQRDKYSRQILFAGIGEPGQEALLRSSAVVIGCGALGTFAANLLVRAGVGRVRVVDRDFVEPSNLQRQTLFEESDARDALPKAVAAERRLRAINSSVQIEGFVADVTPKNAAELVSGFSLILDGTDNFETRLLLNDAAISLAIPWIYAAAVGSYGVTMTIRPGESPCLACLLESGGSGSHNGNGSAHVDASSQPNIEATCDTAGVLNAAVGVIASIEAAEAIKLLAGKPEALNSRLTSCDVWTGKFQSIGIARNPDCRACARREFAYLDGAAQPHITLCGRDSVQIHERHRHLDLAELSRRLASASAAEVRNNDFLLRFRIAPYELTVFADGRAIIKGTKDPAVARSLYARYIGA